MPNVWTCRCGGINKGSRLCDACGSPRRRGDEKPDTSGWAQRCGWTHEGRHCLLRPTMQESVKRQFCQWHYIVAHDPRLGHDLEAFTRFCEDISARRYCSLFAHYPVEYLWACVRGQEPVHLEPGPCLQASCPYRPEEPPRWAVGQSVWSLRPAAAELVPVAALLPVPEDEPDVF